MANVDIKLGYKDSAWFTANATLVLKVGQIVFLEQTGTYKLGDGVTQLSALTFLGSSGGGSWGSITGTLSNQTDLQNALNTKEDTSNKSIDINTDQASNTKYPSVKAIYDWAVGLFVKTPGLTNNFVPRATNDNTIVDGSIYDDCDTVSANVQNASLYLQSSRAYISYDDGIKQGFISNSPTSTHIYHTDKIKLDAPSLEVPQLTPSQIVGTDASKNLVSIPFGTTAGTVLEGDKGLLISNNLSDLSNFIIARNNLKEWDLRITTGNQSTTSNVATNITGLVSPTLTANKLYDFEGHIYTGCNNIGGVKFQITIPTGATIVACFDGSVGSNSTFQSSLVLASATLTGFNFIQFNGSNIIKVKGQVLLGGTAGPIQFGFASAINTQTSTVYQLGTYLTVTQIN